MKPHGICKGYTLVRLVAVAVDPIHEAAESFYRKYGFIKIPGKGKTFIAMDTIRTA
jgi:hypothetical protein